MRRKLDSSKFVFFILAIAFFTILSYFFDQMVIRKEDDLRNQKIQLENYNVKINNINNLSSQMMSLQQYAASKYLTYGKYRNYWFKNIILLLDETILNNERLEIKDNFISYSFATELVKTRFIDFYDSGIWDQLRRLAPARANTTLGVLIEPNILERSKVIVGKPPEFENVYFENADHFGFGIDMTNFISGSDDRNLVLTGNFPIFFPL